MLAGWDSVGEASEFFAGYQAFWEAKTGGSSGVELGDGNWKLVTADPGNYAHNPQYSLELLYDAIADLSGPLGIDMDALNLLR